MAGTVVRLGVKIPDGADIAAGRARRACGPVARRSGHGAREGRDAKDASELPLSSWPPAEVEAQPPFMLEPRREAQIAPRWPRRPRAPRSTDAGSLTLVYNPSASPPRVVYAYYAEHSDGTWVTSPYLVGSQTRSYVTNGGHADYPDTCTDWVHNCPADLGNRDGALTWGRASDTECDNQCVLPLDPAWVAWNGRWGASP
jgi:hypothetical protein